MLFRDFDVLLLFDPSLDGVEDPEARPTEPNGSRTSTLATGSGRSSRSSRARRQRRVLA